MMKPTLLVLAAGMGSRYGGLKQIDAVGPNGETIIDYSVFDAIKAGFGKVVFIIRRDIEQAFKEAFGTRFEQQIQVEYVYQELDALPDGFTAPASRTKPWGTGHAILMAKDVIDEPFAVINGDDFYGYDAFKTAADFLSVAKDDEKARYSMVSYQLRNTLSPNGSVSRGVCHCDEDGYLAGAVETHGIVEKGGAIVEEHGIALDVNSPVSMNFWGFTPSLFMYLESQFVAFLNERGHEETSEFYIPSVVNEIIDSQQGTVAVLTCEAQWFGVTYQEDKPFVQKSIAELVEHADYPRQLWL